MRRTIASGGQKEDFITESCSSGTRLTFSMVKRETVLHSSRCRTRNSLYDRRKAKNTITSVHKVLVSK